MINILPTDRERVYMSWGYWKLYPDNDFFRERKLNGRPHYGIDYAPKKAYKDQDIIICAPVGGTVKAAYFSKSYGKIIKVQSTEDDGHEHRLAHLDKFYIKRGDVIKKGQIIGLMGNTGFSRGKHLHYEVRKIKNGKLVPINPAPFCT